jgi:hypothetical protein
MSDKELDKDLEEIETQMVEDSADLAIDFIYEKLLPLLDNFEENNEDPTYVYGVATHGLFVELVQRLGEMGYTEKDLRKEIKVYLNNSFGQVIH